MVSDVLKSHKTQGLLGYLRRPGVLWEGDIISQDICKGLVPALALEGSRAEEHFIDQYTERPPIHCACMSTAFDDFWCNVLFCTDEGICTEIGYA